MYFSLTAAPWFRICMLFCCLSAPALSLANDYRQLVRERIREKIEMAQATQLPVQAGQDLLLSKKLLPRFYQNRAFKTVWVEEDGLSKEATQIVKILSNAGTEGLRPNDYHLKILQEKLAKYQANKSDKKPLSIDRLAEVELLLTDAYLIYGSHLYYGKVNPETARTEWKAERKNQEVELDKYLERAFESQSLSLSLQKLSPQQSEYKKLKKALEHYKTIAHEAAEFTPIPSGKSLRKGDADARIVAIRARLIQTRDLKRADQTSEEYDETLETVVKRFQARHGLAADGVIGEGTLNALNIGPEERIRKIEINLERWRWLPENLGQEYVMVNIPDFKLNVIDTDSSRLNLSAIVGKTQRKTPVFSGRMTYMVLNPSWTVPPTILAQDILPELRKSTDYLKKKNIKVLTANGTVVDPETVNWKNITAANCPYILRQDPGENNALGIIKFMFPNQYNVYIHDTPTKDLFAKEERAFSSGCIRLQNPMELAYYLLRGSQKWKPETIQQLLSTKKEQTVMLPKPLNVHFLYLTSWAEQDGALVHFRKDIYERDEAIYAALKSAGPVL